MRTLYVYIEISGSEKYVGKIVGDTPDNAQFAYDNEYIAAVLPPISISLPISVQPFSAERTRNFFEGLLPEGFARKSVAGWIHAREDDYLTILSVLGSECLGALRITENTDDINEGSYEPLSIEEVKALAKEGISKSTEIVTDAHLSLTGASGKVGLYYDAEDNVWYKPMGNAPSTHIVKQSHVRLEGIVTNEQLCLMTAKQLGIEIPESFIINTGSSTDEDILFATKRYDRTDINDSVNKDTLRRVHRLHQEDFAQALGIASRDKYETGDKYYLRNIFEILRAYAVNPITDQLKLWDILIYDFLVGNTDNHIKNLSLLYSEDLRHVYLAPAYDIISTVIYAGSNREMAIGIGGERDIDKINRNSFISSASDAGINRKLALKHVDTISASFEEALSDTAMQLEEAGYLGVQDIKDKILKNGGYAHL